MIVRPATAQDAQGISEVMVATWQTAYAGLLPADFLESLSVADNRSRWLQILDEWSDTSCVFVAEAGGGIAGFASGGRERDLDPKYLGELYSIYVLAEHQGQGLGRRLTAAVSGWLIAHGMPSMMVWVLRGNSRARAFYERLGGVHVRDTRRPLLSLEVDEAGYGWEDAASLGEGAG